jgi:hypothetical protein
MIALGALNSRLELTKEKISKDRLLTFLKVLPILSWDFSIWSSFTVLDLEIRLFGYFVDILVQALHEDWKHLLTILLREAGELRGFSCHHLLDVPRSNVLLASDVHFLQKLGERQSQLASCTVGVSLVQVPLENTVDIKLNQWLCVCKALQDTIHEAGISQVWETG